MGQNWTPCLARNSLSQPSKIRQNEKIYEEAIQKQSNVCKKFKRCEFCLFLSSEIALEEITFVKNKSTIISGLADCRLRDHSLWKKLEKVLGIIRPFVHCMSCLPRWGFLRMFLSRILREWPEGEDKVPRLTITTVIWILASDTETGAATPSGVMQKKERPFKLT